MLSRVANPSMFGRQSVSYIRQKTITTNSYDGHIPLNWFENAFLTVGSAMMSLANPRRGGMCFDINLCSTEFIQCLMDRHDCCIGRDNSWTQFTAAQGSND